MYLAPLNYDRYFKKVFSDLAIAKRFLEDFLDVVIEKIEILPLKKAITDDAQYVEFDFRCLIDKSFVIIDMQQWYKPDIVQRFYLYHTLNTALQLENLPKKVIILPENKIKEVRDYSGVYPVITIIWMVQDNLNSHSDYESFTLTSENVLTFIHDMSIWKQPEIQELILQRNTLLTEISNNSKNLLWQQKNRLIYAFQKNIVANPEFAKYKVWFELAEKTLKKISDKFAYSEYEKDSILREVVRRLRRELENPEEIKYIEDYDNYIEGIKRYDNGIRNEGFLEAENKYVPLLEEKIELLEEKDKELQTKDKELEEKNWQLQIERKNTITLLKSLNLDNQTIAEKMEISITEVEKYE